MNWKDIDPALRRRACEVMGYTSRYGGIVNGWGIRWSDKEGRDARWGFDTEEDAWDEGFRLMCDRFEVLRHKKGGIYRVVGTAKLALPRWAVAGVDGIEMMTYEHLAPHARESWVRDLAEFREEGRFVRITP